jgi:hypothetical protein
MAVTVKNRYNLLSSEARTDHDDTGSVLRKYNAHFKGLRLTVEVSAFTGTSITFTIQGYDPLSDSVYTLLASAAITGTGTTTYLIYPGCVAVANAVANNVLPEAWQVTATGTITSATYSVRAELIP